MLKPADERREAEPGREFGDAPRVQGIGREVATAAALFEALRVAASCSGRRAAEGQSVYDERMHALANCVALHQVLRNLVVDVEELECCLAAELADVRRQEASDGE